MSEAVCNVRVYRPINANWKKNVDADFQWNWELLYMVVAVITVVLIVIGNRTGVSLGIECLRLMHKPGGHFLRAGLCDNVLNLKQP